MRKIVAIGGGGFGTKHSTKPINEEIIKLTKKKNPNLLFIPTASLDSQEYVKNIQEHFDKLNCPVDVLYLIKEKPNRNEIKNKINSADIIYVGGGNTLRMMTLWRNLGVDQLLLKAYQSGKVMCGVSAGSICWFKFGNSDSRKFKNPEADFIKVTGLGFINALHCPHYDSEKERQKSLKNMMKKVSQIAIAIDDYCAIEVIDDKYRILSTKPEANAYKIYWKNGKFVHEVIEQKEKFESLEELLTKN